ncbi:unnamed protein product, partial [marine sediment metagenome]
AKDLSYERLAAGQDPVGGEIIVRGPPVGTKGRFFKYRMEERVSFFLSGL